MGYDLAGDGDLEFWNELDEDDDELDEKPCYEIPCPSRLGEAAAPTRGFLPFGWRLFRRRS